MIVYRTGNAAEPPERPAIIMHVVNDVGAWGKGFTAALDASWPQAQGRYRSWASGGGDGVPFWLGRARIVPVDAEKTAWVAHLCAQHSLRSRENPRPLDYQALRDACGIVGHWLNVAPDLAWTLHAPRLGCGLAGGEWSRVAEILDETFPKRTIYVYDLPVTP